MKGRSFLFLSSGSRVPSSVFRIPPFVSRMTAEGHRCVLRQSFPQKYDYFPWMGFRPSQLLKRSVRWWHWLEAKLRKFDAVWIDREIFDAPDCRMEERFRGATRRLILDLDDAVFLRYEAKFRRLLPLADTIVCGNRHIEEFVAPFNPNTARIPTCLDLDRFTLRPDAATAAHSELPVVGWMGTTGNLAYVVEIASALRQLHAVHPFRLRLIVPDLKPLAGVDLGSIPIDHAPWSLASEVADLHKVDVGIMPLKAEQAWDKYKCGLKLLQYLGVGIPAVATPSGVNLDICRDCPAAFAATSESEWVSHLQGLLESSARREALKRQARGFVEQHFSVDAHFSTWKDVILGRQAAAHGESSS